MTDAAKAENYHFFSYLTPQGPVAGDRQGGRGSYEDLAS